MCARRLCGEHLGFNVGASQFAKRRGVMRVFCDCLLQTFDFFLALGGLTAARVLMSLPGLGDFRQMDLSLNAFVPSTFKLSQAEFLTIPTVEPLGHFT
ncbi:MAG: hypothetical protein ACREDR_18810 [Blastocatellia bacterium]